jgi:hypothetical protein
MTSSTAVLLVAVLGMWGALGVLLWRCSYVVTCKRLIYTSPEKFWRFAILLCGALLVTAQIRFGGEFRISDGVEYAASALSFSEGHGLTLPLHGVRFPSRYSPWFSVLFLSPFYFLFDQLWVGIVAVSLSALVALYATWLLGLILGGVSGGICAVTILCLNSGFRYFCGNIMTEVPVYALLAVLALLWISAPVRLLVAIVVSILTALGIGIRPTFAGVFLLFLWKFRRSAISLAALVFFPASLVVANLYYNQQVFGFFFRTGYHYWMSVPYDFVNLTFSLNYLPNNLSHASTFLQSLGLLFLLPVAKKISVEVVKPSTQTTLGKPDFNKPTVPAVVFLLVTSLPVVAFYLQYFYGTDRFYLPYLQLSMVILAAEIGGIIFVRCLAGLGVACSATLLLTFFSLRESLPRQKLLIDLEEKIKPGDTLVSSLNPLLLESTIAREKKINILPLNRSVEYASKVVTPFKPSLVLAPTTSPFSHRDSVLMNAGAEDVYPEVFVENKGADKEKLFIVVE